MRILTWVCYWVLSSPTPSSLGLEYYWCVVMKPPRIPGWPNRLSSLASDSLASPGECQSQAWVRGMCCACEWTLPLPWLKPGLSPELLSWFWRTSPVTKESSGSSTSGSAFSAAVPSTSRRRVFRSSLWKRVNELLNYLELWREKSFVFENWMKPWLHLGESWRMWGPDPHFTPRSSCSPSAGCLRAGPLNS